MLADSLDSVDSCGSDGNSPYQVVLAALDFKDAFLQVPQEKLVMVSLYNQQYVIRCNLPGQRLRAKAWYWHFRKYISETLDCSWCIEQPCLAKRVAGGISNCFLIHEDDLLFAGSRDFWEGKFLPAVTNKFNVNFSEIEGDGSSIHFLKRQLVKVKDSLLVVPGTTAGKIIAYFEKFFGFARSQKIPCDSSIQNDDKSQLLNENDSKAFRSVIGLYAARDRVDVMYCVKELSSFMSCPTVCALQKMRKLVGYLKATGDMAMRLSLLSLPEFGNGKLKKNGEKFWNVEAYTDANWSARKTHRRSTSCAVHFVNGIFAYASSRTQRVVSLSSAESELHSMVSGCSDAIFLRRCMQFLTGDEVEQWQWVDNSAARQLIERQGVGKVRHLSGKILWMQSLVLEKEVSVGQVATHWNLSDIGTKPLAKQRLLVLLNQIGACDPETLEMIGEEEFKAFEERVFGQKTVKRVAKAIMRMALMWGLEPSLHVGAEAAGDNEVCLEVQASGKKQWRLVAMACNGFDAYPLVWFGNAWRKVSTDLQHCWNQVGDEDGYISTQEKRIDDLVSKLERMQIQIEQDYAMLSDRIETTSNEVSMTHDYATGLRYSLVENGGVLDGCGLTQAQWVHLTTLERANLISTRALGSVEYMRLVGQRFSPQGAADETDNVALDENESEDMPMDDGMEISTGTDTVTSIVEFLKAEHLKCLDNGDVWDANEIQHTILGFLEEVRTENAATMVERCREKVAELLW